jgi:predicted adenine nucleotide alpha hydrolase (AANH) superfamily ATPase
MLIDSLGNVGIGPTPPDQYRLRVSGGDARVDGFVYLTSTQTTSDRRFKTDIDTIKNALSTIESLAGVTYSWKTEAFPERNFSKERQIGLIAQDVEKVLPEVVHTDADGYKSMSYDKLTAVLIEAVKDQQKIIESQKSINDNQQNEIEQLKTSLQELKAAFGLNK